MATITDTFRPTRSAANAGRRPASPSAERYSTTRFCPSMKPPAARPWRNAVSRAAYASNDTPLKSPITGIALCCARANAGHAMAPSPAMNSLRRMFDPHADRGSLSLRRRQGNRLEYVLLHCMSPFMGLLGHPDLPIECPIVGAKPPCCRAYFVPSKLSSRYLPRSPCGIAASSSPSTMMEIISLSAAGSSRPSRGKVSGFLTMRSS
jgi:hypothetical protein